MTANLVPLIVRRTIAAPRERIFGAFASADALSRWFTPNSDVSLEILTFDFTVGGRFRFRYRLPGGRQPVVGGIYERIGPPNRIQCTWLWEAPDPLAGILMRVEFAFRQTGARTEVVVTHHGIPSDQLCGISEEGWDGSLENLDRHLGEAN